MQYRDYLRLRKLAFALKEVRDREKSILDIALIPPPAELSTCIMIRNGFSSISDQCESQGMSEHSLDMSLLHTAKANFDYTKNMGKPRY